MSKTHLSLALSALSAAGAACAASNPAAPQAESGASLSAPSAPAPATPSSPAAVRPPATAASTSATSAAPPSTPPVPPAPGEWATWSHEQKLAYMKAAVMPDAKALFSAYEGARYAGFTCRSCHGAGADNGSYTMPNPDLPKLPGSPAGWKAMGDSQPRIVEFMRTEVVDHMTHLLSEPRFDMKTRTGFGCLHCHTTVKP